MKKTLSIFALFVLSTCCFAVRPTLNNFTAGELSPYLNNRYDLSKYDNGCARLENMLVLPYGPAIRRPGTKFIAEVKDSNNPVTLLSFEYSKTDTYLLEVGHKYIRFFRNQAPVKNVDDSIYELATTFDGNDIFELQHIQSADIMYFAHPNYPPQMLSRYDHNDWDIEAIDFEGGPFLEENPLGPTKYANDCTGSGTPSANGTTEGNVSYLFDNSYIMGSYWGYTGAFAHWIKYDFGAGITKTIRKYTISAGDDQTERMPKAWNFQGSNNDADWTTLNTQTNQTSWTLREKKQYTFLNSTAYRYYRFWITEGNTSNVERIYEIELMESTYDAPTITPSSTAGEITLTASDPIFDSLHIDSIWQIIHEIGGQETKGIVLITGVTDPCVADANVIENLASNTATERWAEGAWSDYRGYPYTLTFFQERFVFAGSPARPQTIWSSAVADYYNMAEGDEDNDSHLYVIPNQNPIQWITVQKELLIGTLLGAGVMEGLGTADHYKSQVGFGSAYIQAINCGDTVLYVDRAKRKVHEFVYNFERDKFLVPDMTLLSEHITSSGIKTWAYQERPNAAIFCLLNNGDIAYMTYKREEEVVAWSRLITDDDFESVAVKANTNEDEAYFAIKRTINGQTKRYIELLMPQDWGTDQEDCFFVDCGIKYDSTPLSTLSGLDHLVGETVYILADANFIDTQIVDANGEVPLEKNGKSVTASVVIAGLPYTSVLETMPIVFEDPQGSVSGLNKQITEIHFDFYKTLGTKFGKSGLTYDVPFGTTSLFTGQKRLSFPYGYVTEAKIYIEQLKPFPLCLREIVPSIMIVQR